MKKCISIALMLVPVAGIFLIIFLLHLPDDTHLWREIHNSGHTPLFGILSLLLLALFNISFPASKNRSLKIYLSSFISAVVLGGAVEIIQFWVPGEPDLCDLLRDIAGSISFLGFYSLVDKSSIGRDLKEYGAMQFAQPP
jgi:hypothetical protein